MPCAGRADSEMVCAEVAGRLDMHPGRAWLMRGPCPVTEPLVPLAKTYRPFRPQQTGGTGWFVSLTDHTLNDDVIEIGSKRPSGKGGRLSKCLGERKREKEGGGGGKNSTPEPPQPVYGRPTHPPLSRCQKSDDMTQHNLRRGITMENVRRLFGPEGVVLGAYTGETRSPLGGPNTPRMNGLPYDDTTMKMRRGQEGQRSEGRKHPEPRSVSRTTRPASHLNPRPRPTQTTAHPRQ